MSLFKKQDRTKDRRFHTPVHVSPDGGILMGEDDMHVILDFIGACNRAGFRILQVEPALGKPGVTHYVLGTEVTV